ncbi:GNAT family N-acetyltransferase [Streptomyces millisiae]|uniref:GNAT family N-acetyltransferase n=1 Tax=Streptomyces millisiae TaxID=3075542 RepID=A0ABU2LJB5_9ACTN|nr:GNAT family N-acetyltransferase [Streptomyces sp. DSM 44918]MDT0317685.1 GNAT family N-acetyltransferase [Streptomyces sp. DSM 44918]
MTPAIRETGEIRPATAADLDGVVSVFLGCWRESYPAVLPPEVVAAMTEERATALWRSAPGELRVATADSGEILGVTRWATDGQIHSLYVAPSAQGLGLGAALLRAATEAMRSAGARDAHLWAFRANEPALAFYRRQGWHEDGTTRVQAEFGEPEVRLTRALAAREAR